MDFFETCAVKLRKREGEYLTTRYICIFAKTGVVENIDDETSFKGK